MPPKKKKVTGYDENINVSKPDPIINKIEEKDNVVELQKDVIKKRSS